MAEEVAVKEEKMTEVQKPTTDAKKPKAPPATAPKRTVKKKSQSKAIFVTSKRKSSIARASLKTGSGIIRINGFDINSIEPRIYKEKMLEPIRLSRLASELSKRVDITINVSGGGMSGQMQAVRGAIAKSLAEYDETLSIKTEYMRFDRYILVDDYRRVEPKKFKGPKARARFQKSYR